MSYDSTPDTLEHIHRVQDLMLGAKLNIARRAILHDRSKLEEPEKSVFDNATLRLRDVTYGSDEYKACLAEMKPALEHHYANNDHHPENKANGINGMSLMALIEMLADWKAAGERHSDSTLEKSIRINVGRFGINLQLEQILLNTARELGWL